MKLPDACTRATPLFDDENLVSFAGLAPVMALAERAELSQLIEARVRFRSTKIASAGVNPAGKLSSIIAGMAAGADCIDDRDALRAGGMKQVFGGVYAAATPASRSRNSRTPRSPAASSCSSSPTAESGGLRWPPYGCGISIYCVGA